MYVNEVNLSTETAPSKPREVARQACFISAAAPLRRLAIANFSTKLARLNAVLENADSSTHAATLNSGEIVASKQISSRI